MSKEKKPLVYVVNYYNRGLTVYVYLGKHVRFRICRMEVMD